MTSSVPPAGSAEADRRFDAELEHASDRVSAETFAAVLHRIAHGVIPPERTAAHVMAVLAIDRDRRRNFGLSRLDGFCDCEDAP